MPIIRCAERYRRCYREEQAEIGKEFVTGISNAAKFLAGLYEYTGQCAIRQAAMEHNQAYTIERVYAEVMR